jgi:hypothetical protein
MPRSPVGVCSSAPNVERDSDAAVTRLRVAAGETSRLDHGRMWHSSPTCSARPKRIHTRPKHERSIAAREGFSTDQALISPRTKRHQAD